MQLLGSGSISRTKRESNLGSPDVASVMLQPVLFCWKACILTCRFCLAMPTGTAGGRREPRTRSGSSKLIQNGSVVPDAAQGVTGRCYGMVGRQPGSCVGRALRRNGRNDVVEEGRVLGTPVVAQRRHCLRGRIGRVEPVRCPRRKAWLCRSSGSFPPAARRAAS